MIIGDIFSRVVSTIQSQINGMTGWMTQVQNIGTTLAQKAQQKLQKFMQTLTGDPKSKDDYWKILGLYFAKKFVITATVVVCVLGYLLIAFAYPWAEGKLWRATIKLNSPKYSKFAGKAKVIDTMEITVYVGDMSNGTPEGVGTQYNSDGLLVYKGEFKAGKYSGEGELYSTDGIMTYKGQLDNNKAHGEGQQFNNVGKIIYTGNFAVGQRAGVGIEYDPKTTIKKYYGEFANDTREGNGVEYGEDGETIVYEGTFKAGTYDGIGKLYDAGNLLYSGSFMNGFYSGDGILYDKDIGVMVYAGEFKEGKYDGTGKLYDVDTSVVIYEGEFSKGKKQGTGKSYDKLGSQSFDGEFRGDSIDYIAYLGSSVDNVTTQFGPESYRAEKDNKLILTYLTLDSSIIFKIDPEKGEYACEKVVIGTKNDFMGLGVQSTAVERKAVMGEPFSSINFSCPDYYSTIFSHLAININNIKKVPSDKYIMDNYFIRFYFNDGKTELKCIEICSM
jgi:hypothetical protein